ncbi:MAG: hypothetical protein ABW019_08115 [Chitinophagaceae bacterium]
MSSKHFIGENNPERNNGSGQKHDMDDRLLSRPFPGWISRWAHFYFLLALLVPVLLLYLIRQPVYEQVPCSIMPGDKGFMITARVDTETARNNFAGQRVMLRSSYWGDGKAEGLIQSVAAALDHDAFDLRIISNRSAEGISSMRPGSFPAAGFDGFVLLKKSSVRIADKIFNW